MRPRARVSASRISAKRGRSVAAVWLPACGRPAERTCPRPLAARPPVRGGSPGAIHAPRQPDAVAFGNPPIAHFERPHSSRPGERAVRPCGYGSGRLRLVSRPLQQVARATRSDLSRFDDKNRSCGAPAADRPQDVRPGDEDAIASPSPARLTTDVFHVEPRGGMDRRFDRRCCTLASTACRAPTPTGIRVVVSRETTVCAPSAHTRVPSHSPNRAVSRVPTSRLHRRPGHGRFRARDRGSGVAVGRRRAGARSAATRRRGKQTPTHRTSPASRHAPLTSRLAPDDALHPGRRRLHTRRAARTDRSPGRPSLDGPVPIGRPHQTSTSAAGTARRRCSRSTARRRPVVSTPLPCTRRPAWHAVSAPPPTPRYTVCGPRPGCDRGARRTSTESPVPSHGAAHRSGHTPASCPPGSRSTGPPARARGSSMVPSRSANRGLEPDSRRPTPRPHPSARSDRGVGRNRSAGRVYGRCDPVEGSSVTRGPSASSTDRARTGPAPLSTPPAAQRVAGAPAVDPSDLAREPRPAPGRNHRARTLERLRASLRTHDCRPGGPCPMPGGVLLADIGTDVQIVQSRDNPFTPPPAWLRHVSLLPVDHRPRGIRVRNA